MRNLSYPGIRQRLGVSLPVLAACLAFPAAASAEAPISVVTTKNVSGAPGDAIPLAVAVSAKPGQSVSNTYLVGLPTGARLADVDHAVTAADEKAAIDVTNWDLPRLTVMLPSTRAGTYTLAVVAVSRPDNGGPMNFTSSTFTLNATWESREPASVPEPKQPDGSVVREAQRSSEAPPLSAAAPGNEAVKVGGLTQKMTPPVTEVIIPQAATNLWREQTLSAIAAPPALAGLPAAPPAVTPPAPAPAAEVDGKALVERAERLIRLGDISGARLVLERAAGRGDSRATFLLAQTCDPLMLRAWKVQGLKPDPDRARALYDKAAQEGQRETGPVTGAMR